jgi:ParB-like chromosome segregation protein Spo0J
MSDTLKFKGKLIPDYPIADLKEYKNNTKKHTPETTAKLAALIKENGFTDPILVNKKGVIIAGHGRRLAMIELGYKTIPAFVFDHLTSTQERALRVSHNKAASVHYDAEKMAIEVKELYDLGVSQEQLGLDAKEFEIMTKDLDVQNDDAFVDDLQAAVEEQNEETHENIAEMDERMVPLYKALGFKEVPKASERSLLEFMARIESETGKKGQEAFCDFVAGVMAE